MKISDNYSWLKSDYGIDGVCIKSGKIEALLTNIGASVVSLKTPDRNGVSENIILGYSDMREYLKNPFYLGSTIGRVAGRIAAGKLKIQNLNFSLSQNEQVKNHLHGGFKGLSHRRFETENIHTTTTGAGVDFYYCSESGEEGYPGKLAVWVKYRLEKNRLTIVYEASTDHITPVNLTNHCYFNLSARDDKSLRQELYIASDHILETGEGYIPTGKIIAIKDTSYDFQKLKAIRADKCDLPYPGYNEYYILNKPLATILYDAYSGRKLAVETSYPGVLFYSGDYLGDPFAPCQGVCLEAQHYPDAVNHAHFPNVLLQPGQHYKQYITYTFSA